MPINESRRAQYLLATLLPLLVTAITWFLHGYISAANITLIYIVAVIFTAVNTGTRPALLAALVSFLAFNLSFTEPRGSLFVIGNQDMLTAGLFLVTAIVVGQLAASVKEHLELLQMREKFSNMELRFLEQLTGAFEPEQIMAAMTDAIAQLPELRFDLIEIKEGEPCWRQGRHQPPAALKQKIDIPIVINPVNPEQQTYQDGQALFTVLNDNETPLYGLLVINTPPGAIASVRLLTNQCNLALARTRLADDLEAERVEKENELMRSSLLSSVSHDFRTPLTAMVGASSTLLELSDQLNDEQKRELLESILLEARRLNSYTQKLLDMTRLGRGELKLNRSTITIDELLNVTLKRIRQQYPRQRINTRIEPDLPPLVVHAALIEQALYNVLENACKFSSSDQNILINCNSESDSLLIDVEDAGPGIPDSEKAKVFEMFHSADQGDRRAAGSGLGLAICKGMVGAHGGSVEIHDSRTLGGSLVRIRLPLAAEPQEARY